jgi:hypothetical protein
MTECVITDVFCPPKGDSGVTDLPVDGSASDGSGD